MNEYINETEKKGVSQSCNRACSCKPSCPNRGPTGATDPTGAKEKILPSLCRSFQYDAPRAEVCCTIGDYFFERDELQQAIF